jgi:endonuclease/exonuclease/phosphatase family metal-dependent hydrolase
VERDPHFQAECQALAEALRGHPTVVALRTSPAWKDLEPRLTRLLSRVHRYHPQTPPPPPSSLERVLAVHWNIEHGNWYEQVEGALLSHPMLQAADVLFFNEIDLGMARAGNRDVAGDLAGALGLYGCWAPLFLETTVGRDDDAQTAGDGQNQEGLFGVAILSRWPIGEVRIIDLPSPERYQFDLERMYGRHIGLVATIERPGAPFVAVSTHLEVHRTRRDRARQIRDLTAGLRAVVHPVILAGDFNSHTFDRGRVWDSIARAFVLMTWSTDTCCADSSIPIAGDSGAVIRRDARRRLRVGPLQRSQTHPAPSLQPPRRGQPLLRSSARVRVGCSVGRSDAGACDSTGSRRAAGARVAAPPWRDSTVRQGLGSRADRRGVSLALERRSLGATELTCLTLCRP